MGLNSVADYERRAREILSSDVWKYYEYGRERRWCHQDSINAFSRYRVRSQVLQDVSKRSLATTVLGQPLKYPICVAPSAHHSLAHRDAERATAKGSEAAETLMLLSSASNTRMKDVAAAAAPNGLRWMQIYPFTDRQLTLDFVRRAERFGFKALVVTVDSPAEGMDGRIHELFSEEPISSDLRLRFLNYEVDIPASKAAFAKDPRLTEYMIANQFNAEATWEYIRWIKANTFLPIVCKGILTCESARAAADAGVDGILVSAHGGRQMDGAPAPIDALAEVVHAVRGRDIEVYMDGGIRTGSDVFKALGRGARAVFVGRPILWGLACEGAKGVKNILDILRTELDGVLAISGCTSPNTIPENTVVHESYYHRGPRWNSTKSKL